MSRSIALAIPFLLFSSCEVLQGVLGDLNTGGLSSAEVVRGLKAALEKELSLPLATLRKKMVF